MKKFATVILSSLATVVGSFLLNKLVILASDYVYYVTTTVTSQNSLVSVLMTILAFVLVIVGLGLLVLAGIASFAIWINVICEYDTYNTPTTIILLWLFCSNVYWGLISLINKYPNKDILQAFYFLANLFCAITILFTVGYFIYLACVKINTFIKYYKIKPTKKEKLKKSIKM